MLLERALQHPLLRHRVDMLEKDIVTSRERDWKWQTGVGAKDVVTQKPPYNASPPAASASGAPPSEAELEAKAKIDAANLDKLDKLEVLAWLRSTHVVFAMRTRQVLLGRSTAVRPRDAGVGPTMPCLNRVVCACCGVVAAAVAVWCVRSQQCPVDIDVAQAGHATRVSRRQAVIKLRSDGMFYITNIGKNPFWINGKVGDRVLASQMWWAPALVMSPHECACVCGGGPGTAQR